MDLYICGAYLKQYGMFQKSISEVASDSLDQFRQRTLKKYFYSEALCCREAACLKNENVFETIEKGVGHV